MRHGVLGEFEELVLLIIAMQGGESYGLAVRNEIAKQLKRKATIGAVHATIARLEKKGMVKTYMGDPTNARGGRRKRLINITKAGHNALAQSRDLKLSLWSQIPSLKPDSGSFNYE